jgi:UDP-N-acetylglucosamine transferase subunit ALG13
VIFVTVGTQLAFDRLVGVMDQWAGCNPSTKVFAQVGPTKLDIRHMEYQEFVTPDKANSLFIESALIVAHAGMGSILTALKYRKPILIVPRKAALGEHRNDHQMATAKWLSSRPGISVAWDENEVVGFLDNPAGIQAGGEISEYASPELIERLKTFIAG